jgi:uncharacterized protein (DUF2267 family)
MSLNGVDPVERAVHKTNEWLSDLAKELQTDDREHAWGVLRAYLHVLRDELTIDEAAQLAVEFPPLLCGVFYEGFDPAQQPATIRDPGEFLIQFALRAAISDPAEAARSAEAATRVLRHHVSEGELEHVLVQLPSGVREVLQHD